MWKPRHGTREDRLVTLCEFARTCELVTLFLRYDTTLPQLVIYRLENRHYWLPRLQSFGVLDVVALEFLFLFRILELWGYKFLGCALQAMCFLVQ